MKAIFLYLSQVIAISAMLYGYYYFFLRNKRFHTYNRYFLLISFILSIVIPFINIPVYFTEEVIKPSPLLKTLTFVSAGGFEEYLRGPGHQAMSQGFFTRSNIFTGIYFAALLLFLYRFATGIFKIIGLKRKYTVEKMHDIDFMNTSEAGTPFSFFKNLFWNEQIELSSSGGQQIFRHEWFHMQQHHSIDIVLSELITVVFWMNPFFFMMKKEIKAIHEFLADRFAAIKYEEWDYAELLLMQVLGSPNDHLTNQFFHNQIKRRIAMITSSKNPSYQYLRKLLILPVAVLLTVLFAFKYKTKENYSSLYKPLEKVVTVIIDAGHGESDPGVIAGDGTKECDLTLQLAQKIKLLNKNERVHIVLTRNSRETVDLRSRSDLANAQHPDLFISLHVSSTGNKAESQETSGFEVYISKKNSSYLAENKIFGGILLNYLTNLYKTNNKIQQRDMGIWVLDNSSCPSALIECGYITNKQDLDFIKNPSNQNKIAESILHSVEQFAGQRESPDFNDRKKQVSDTTKPVVKIVKNKDGKITGTVNGILIRDLVADNHLRLAGFVLQDNSLIAVPENDLKEVIAKYGTLWDEFYSSFKSRQLSIDKRPAEE